jgi:hypothetical protein
MIVPPPNSPLWCSLWDVDEVTRDMVVHDIENSEFLELAAHPFANALCSLATISEILARSGSSLGKGLSGGLTLSVRQIANGGARPHREILGTFNKPHANLPSTFGDFLSGCKALIRGMQ